MSSILQPLRAGRFRHVVFASGFGARRAVNLARMPESKHCRDAGAATRTRLTRDERALISHVLGQGGLDVDAYRPETLQRRVPACLRALRQPDARCARQALENDPALLPVALSAMIIGVTSFFRDAAVFDYLTFHALPNLARAALSPLRIWSAGCSDGAELWSVAILLSELGLLERATLLGTDCREDAIRRARAGVYEDSQLREMVEPWRDRYFHRHTRGWQLVSSLARVAQWRRSDLLSEHEPGPWDLILCRNMAMYVRPEHAGKLWIRLEESLRPGGYLVLGKAERPLGALRLTAVAPCVYRRKGEWE